MQPVSLYMRVIARGANGEEEETGGIYEQFNKDSVNRNNR